LYLSIAWIPFTQEFIFIFSVFWGAFSFVMSYQNFRILTMATYLIPFLAIIERKKQKVKEAHIVSLKPKRMIEKP
jgi:hypothetical protein